MRKFLPLLLVLVVALSGLSSAAISGNIPGTDIRAGVEEKAGINIFWAYNEAENPLNDIYVDVDSYQKNDYNQELGGQDAAITLETRAFIPCYLGLAVAGSNGAAAIESFGPGAKGSKGGFGTNWFIAFDNELGGFVDGNWDPVNKDAIDVALEALNIDPYFASHDILSVAPVGKNAEVRPLLTPDQNWQGNELNEFKYYIKASDDVCALVYSNDHYRYQVESAPLEFAYDENEDSLNLEMRIDEENMFTFDSASTVVVVENADPNTFTLVKHEFRVPYNYTVRHGEYRGNVTFRAFTL